MTEQSQFPAAAEESAETQISDLARRTLEELLARMKIKATVTAGWEAPAAEEEPRPLLLNVHGDDLGVLIGHRGETIAALQYITRLMVCKQVGENVNLVIDVEGYRRRREEQLRRMARRMAEQAVQRRRTMVMEPMPANERRIVHLELRHHPHVRTESIGEGDHRKVTIIPKKEAG